MLTFLFALAAIWTLFWLIMFILNWGERSALAETKVLCSKCAGAFTGATASSTASDSAATKKTSDAPKSASSNTGSKQPVMDKHDQANVKPLFDAPNEKDDLKTIKGIGVVMEKTLNDLGITTFKQLAGFQRADVKMVSDVLSSANAGFGDRIDRDEWVDQAKSLVKKAG